MRFASRVERSAPCTCAIAIAMTIAVVALRISVSSASSLTSAAFVLQLARVLMVRNADILIADDDEISVRFLRRLLSREGHTVSVAATVDAALDACAQKTPDLVLVDQIGRASCRESV